MFSRGLRARLNVDPEDTEDKNSSSAVVAHIEYEHAYFLSNANNRISFERRVASSVSSALDWLDRMTDEQQRDFSLKDPLYKFGSSNKFRAVRFADVISDLDDPLSSFKDVIRSHSNDPEDFLEELEKIEILHRDLKEFRTIEEEHSPPFLFFIFFCSFFSSVVWFRCCSCSCCQECPSSCSV